MENKISCQSGRLKIMDPNRFGGESSSSNIPVNNEDLNISVVLTTYKKGRTILSTTKEGGTFNNTDTVTINFIDGSNINGKKVLTTNYSDLISLDSDGNNNEALGITSIDIDFNSQQAPMVVINFVDVRGAAIFQNEGNIASGKNKYSTFFQLPYPLFELTIKGYYGKPVKYCLHLTKFNTKFNSKTGNFEITTNFIGFTYAMFSDMLIGYLKAIPYTDIGKKRYELINDIRRKNGIAEIMNLNELMIGIEKINEEIKKLSANDVDAAEISNIKRKFEIINSINDRIVTLGSELDIRGSSDLKYNYIVRPISYVLDVNTITSKYIDDVTKFIDEFNENSEITLNIKDFNLPWHYENISIKKLEGVDYEGDIRPVNIIKYIKKDDSKLVVIITDDTVFECWDVTQSFKVLDEVKIKLENVEKQSRQNLGETIRSSIRGKLSIDPTIKNIIEVLTTAVEVFMESIYSIAESAETDSSNKRKTQLKTKFNQEENADYKNVASTKSIIPWPGYREQKEEEGKNVFIEKYIGAKNVLEIPTDVHEVEFIEDLLKGFIEAANQTDLANLISSEVEGSWFPINPVDTRLFGVDKFPYSRVGENGLTSEKEVANLILIRGMTFLSYNNKYLTTKEIEQMAEIEANTMVNSVKDLAIKQVLGNMQLNEFVELKGKINDVERNIINPGLNGGYQYDYFPNSNSNSILKIIPISNGFEGTWSKNIGTDVWEVTASDIEKPVYLTNYNNNKNFNKKIDGGIYLKIFTSKDFNETIDLDLSTKPEKVDITNNILILENLQGELNSPALVEKAGFNCFGGTQGMQEFVNMNFGAGITGDLQLKYLFFRRISEIGIKAYDDINDTTPSTFNKFSGQTSYFISYFEYDSDSESGDRYINDNDNYKNLVKLDYKTSTYPFVNKTYFVQDNSIVFGDKRRNVKRFSLFGSRWYYGQSKSNYPIYSKALLFLNTLPWNGLPFELKEINALFNVRAGFIHVPKLWAAYIGGLLWRANTSLPIMENGKIVGGGSGAVDPIVWVVGGKVLSPFDKDKSASSFIAPTRTENIFELFAKKEDASIYEELNSILLYLPNQVKKEFKNAFFNFVDSGSVILGNNENAEYDFIKLNASSQIINGSLNEFDTKVAPIFAAVEQSSSFNSKYGKINTSVIEFNLVNVDKYSVIMPVIDDKYVQKNIILEYKESPEVTNSPAHIIFKMIEEELVLANTGYKIWEKPITSSFDNTINSVKKDDFELYFNTFIKVLKPKVSTTVTLEEIKKKEQEIFGTSDVDAIKGQLYKTCKNIYDKWLGGTSNIDNIIFQCGARNGLDDGIKNKYREGDNKTRLIDSFRFVDRAFNDIGDLFYLNPEPINDFLINSPNTSVFDVISQLLASNNFTFIPLPTFINYNDVDTLTSMFSVNPSYDEAIKDGICGPAFVAVYAGESSKHLDFNDSEYSNDGIDFVCGKDNNIVGVPSDFTNTSNDYQNDVAVFSVNYSQQNQNIFQDITLDQSEFSETDESLKITDNIANKGVENNIALGGQNIYSVYSVRSYKAEVEMMGNPMIQPMMHFQLNNIPMFHGAYLITRVKHSIKPNHMSTVFSGSRVRYAKTELLTGSDFYMSILDSMNLSNSSSGVIGTVGANGVPPIIATIIDNKGLPSDIEKNQITMTEIPSIVGIRSQIAGNKRKNRLITEAVIPLKNMLTDWVDWMKNTAGFVGFSYPGNSNVYFAEITSAFRSYQDQADAGSNKSTGVSNHQWGIAVDLKMARKNGTLIEMTQNLENFKIVNNPALEWLLNNSWKYGFVIPFGMRDGKGNYNEFWHFEYHGTAAKNLISDNPITYGGHVTKNIDKQKDFVINPKTNDGKVAVYTNGDYVYIKRNQGTIDNGKRIETKLIYEELKKQFGYSDEAIAAVMGNMYQESGFNPTALNKGGGDYGLVQWINTRKTALLAWLSENNLDNSSYIDQIKYLKYELERTFKYTNSNMKNNTDVENATKIFYVTYEGGSLGSINFSSASVEKRLLQLKNADNSFDKRVDYARQFSVMIKTKKFTVPNQIV